jgi:hypothetical protein
MMTEKTSATLEDERQVGKLTGPELPTRCVSTVAVTAMSSGGTGRWASEGTPSRCWSSWEGHLSEPLRGTIRRNPDDPKN